MSGQKFNSSVIGSSIKLWSQTLVRWYLELGDIMLPPDKTDYAGKSLKSKVFKRGDMIDLVFNALKSRDSLIFFVSIDFISREPFLGRSIEFVASYVQIQFCTELACSSTFCILWVLICSDSSLSLIWSLMVSDKSTATDYSILCRFSVSVYSDIVSSLFVFSC